MSFECHPYLAPTFSVTDFTVVLEMNDHFGITRQRPNQTTSIRCWVLLWSLYVYPCMMDFSYGFIQNIDETFHVVIYL